MMADLEVCTSPPGMQQAPSETEPRPLVVPNMPGTDVLQGQRTGPEELWALVA